eukprot:g11937.t1
MDVPDKPADPKEVELTKVDEKTPPKSNNQERLTVDVAIAFWTHLGWDGVSVLLFSLGVTGLFVYLIYLYTKGFQAWHRPGVWVFMVFAVLYILLVVKCLWTWKTLAKAFTVQQQRAKNEEIQGRQKRSKSAIERAKQAAGNAKNVYEKLQINGQWFLWKLYVSEIFESAQQCINLVTVYLNRQIKLDTATDFLCVAVPLSVMWFGYQVPISIPEMLAITLMPTFSMLGKLDDILEEVIHHRAAQQVLREQSRRSFKQKRRRESLFQQIAHLKMAKEQEDKVPRPVRFVAAGCKGLFGLFFLAMAVAHLAMQPSGCDETTWKKGCVNKVPFCTSLFMPTCNCASLKLDNDYKLVGLPNSLVDEMTALRKVFIRNCNLTKLPPRMEQLTKIALLEMPFNKLKGFDVDIGKWERLESLFLNNNNITSYNDAIFTHKNLIYLDLSDNIGLKMQRTRSKVFMPSLVQLAFANNSVEIDATLDRRMFPNLLDLYLSGNTLKVFPDQSLQHSLQYLGVARCHLQKMPIYLKEFRFLRYLDARDNNISMIPEEIKALVKQNKVESYFADNPICQVDKSLDCKPLCSKYCWLRDEPGNGFCNFRCNSKACKYDGGDCE